MASRIALLFPGQGAYLPGIFAGLTEAHPQIRDVLGVVDDIADQNGRPRVASLLLDVTAPTIGELVEREPGCVQLAIYATSVALHRVLTESLGVRADVVCGHSFGEIAALVAAGSFDVVDGARLVVERDRAFERCGPAAGGMLALGMSTVRAAHLIDAASTWHVNVAAENSPTQTVVSGPVTELNVLAYMARAAGIPVSNLPVAYPFHNAMLAPVADVFREATESVRGRPPRVRTFSPVHGRYYGPDDDLAAAIATDMTRPVRFADAVRSLFADGVDTFVECGARSITTDLAGASLPGLRLHAPLRRRTTSDELAAEITKIDGSTIDPVPLPRTPTAPVPQPVERTNGIPNGAALLALLRSEYATVLDYPADVFTDDADLEADLGVDSLKQNEMIVRLREKFGLPAPAAGFRATALRTLPDVAAMLKNLANGAQLSPR